MNARAQNNSRSRDTAGSLVLEAIRKGLRAGRQNLPAMLALESVMGLTVLIYYLWPAARPFFAHLAAAQHAGGVLAGALGTAFAGGLSEISIVYLQNRGRWTLVHLENLGFKMALFFFSGGIVYEFYQLQAHCFGDGLAWSILLPKLFVDQFIYTPFWSVPFQTTFTRWHALRYSWPALGRELRTDLVTERMLPVLITNWMFWIPGISLVYSMPLNLQMPLAIFAAAIWGLLLPAAARQSRTETAEALEDIVVPAP